MTITDDMLCGKFLILYLKCYKYATESKKNQCMHLYA